MSIESVMPSSHLILCHPLLLSSCLQSFPESGSFRRQILYHCVTWETRVQPSQARSKILSKPHTVRQASQIALMVRYPPGNSGDIRDTGSIPGSGRFPGGGHGNPLQYSCLENPWTEETGGLQSEGLQRIRHNWSSLARTHATWWDKVRIITKVRDSC